MTQKQKKPILTFDAAELILQIGSRIRTARKRRSFSSEEMAKKMFVSRKTLYRLEKGDTGISLGVLVSALWALGLEKELLQIANPEKDKAGIFYERQQLSKRIRKKPVRNRLDF